MAKYIEHLTLDISGKRNNIEIFAKQGDRNKRFLKITLVDGETQIILDDNEKAEFRCLKPDKKYVYLAATKEADGTIMVKIDYQVLTVAGNVRADVAIIDEAQNVLSSTNFYIVVEPSATDGRYIPSTSYRKLDMEIDMDGNSIRNLPEPTDDGDAVSKFYVDKASQKTRYIFPIAELENISVNGRSLLKKEIVKRTVTSKAGVSVNIPVISLKIYLYVGEVNFQTEEITPYFDLPVNYVANPTGIDISSISNIEDFSPYIKTSLHLDKFYPLDYFVSDVENYCTNTNIHFGSNSIHFEKFKMVGFCIRLDYEFANETIRDVAYEEFSTIFNAITHLCLEYEEPKIQTIECAYIGG